MGLGEGGDRERGLERGFEREDGTEKMEGGLEGGRRPPAAGRNGAEAR